MSYSIQMREIHINNSFKDCEAVEKSNAAKSDVQTNNDL